MINLIQKMWRQIFCGHPSFEQDFIEHEMLLIDCGHIKVRKI